MKIKYILLPILLIAGCAHQNDYVEGGDYSLDSITACPKVQIKSEDKAIIQTAGGVDLFKIEATGYKGSCRYDPLVLRDKAVVSPQFKITRLTDTNVEDVHFSYYLQTAEGPSRFLGKKTYFATVVMPKGVYELTYTANEGELSAPLGKYDTDIFIGLNALTADSEYKIK